MQLQGQHGSAFEHGQAIYIDPKAEMVIVRYASHPVAGNAANDPITLPAFDALARHLLRI